MVQSIIVDALVGVMGAEQDVKDHHYSNALAKVLANLLVLVILSLVGSNLWNEVLKRLVPSVGKARWYDIALLQILIGLICPC